MALLDQLAGLVQSVEAETYQSFELLARRRIAHRDEDDWPVLAAALALDCPIWTEDTDFFGCGWQPGRQIASSVLGKGRGARGMTDGNWQTNRIEDRAEFQPHSSQKRRFSFSKHSSFRMSSR